MRNAVLALALVLVAGCSTADPPSASPTTTTDPPPVESDDVRPEAASWDCEDPDAPFTQAEWMEHCAEAVDGGEAPTVGDTVDFIDSEGNAGQITLHGVTRYTDPAPDDWDPLPTQPDGFLLVDLEVVGVTGQVFSDSYLSVSMWDTAGHQYQAVTGVLPVEQTLPDTMLLPGRNARGSVAFDVPAGPLTLDYEGLMSSVPLASFEVQG